MIQKTSKYPKRIRISLRRVKLGTLVSETYVSAELVIKEDRRGVVLFRRVRQARSNNAEAASVVVFQSFVPYFDWLEIEQQSVIFLSVFRVCR